ncbi:type II restriction endonuclease [Paenibacillus periandrae]|uniref:type II restriction endonuclease n=1 Tax=Paenibacillus periandrae TaxID=1761741 RepID=UPI001F095CC8|nr:type II restriction endonuclease [Paenibacillus periandrae]
MPSETLDKAINTASKQKQFFCKFIALNDVGMTGGHQEGIYLPVKAAPLFFDEQGLRGENTERWVNFHLQDGSVVQPKAKWYGNKTRKEYRITRFWAHTPFDKQEQLGNLIIIIKESFDDYHVFVLNKEKDIETFLNTFGISLLNNNAVYGVDGFEGDKEDKLSKEIKKYAALQDDFPVTTDVALKARELYLNVLKKREWHPDTALLDWIQIEYTIFKEIENVIYTPQLQGITGNMDLFADFANSVLNRRKSRAGKSLEHHAHFIFDQFELPFAHPGKTEGNKKPDFLFPSNKAYKDMQFPEHLLTFLGAKTTCKDRWRQILNEADRIPQKHLLTLQQGISENQLEEMKAENVVLVVPKPLHKTYPPKYQSELLDLNTFIMSQMEKYS